MASPRLWNLYAHARHSFDLDPSPKNEAAVIATYAEWVRGFAPDEADELISLLCRHLTRWLEQRAAA